MFDDIKRSSVLFSSLLHCLNQRLQSRFQALQAQYSAATQDQTLIHLLNNQIYDCVWLDVGGTHYHTTSQTLANEPDSMLWAWFGSGHWKAEEEDDGYVLIDRDGGYFREVLCWLRGHATLDWITHLTGDKPKSSILISEAIYYSLSNLERVLLDEIASREHYDKMKWSWWEGEPGALVEVSLNGKTVTGKGQSGYAVCEDFIVPNLDTNDKFSFHVKIDHKGLFGIGCMCEKQFLHLKRKSTQSPSCDCHWCFCATFFQSSMGCKDGDVVGLEVVRKKNDQRVKFTCNGRVIDEKPLEIRSDIGVVPYCRVFPHTTLTLRQRPVNIVWSPVNYLPD